MTLLTASGIEMAFGERVLFSDASFMVTKGDRIGLVGANGCGKTTLLRLIAGELEPSGGDFAKKKDLKIGYLEQHAPSEEGITAFEEALKVFGEIIKLEGDLKKTEQALLSHQTEELLLRQAALREKIIAEGGLTYKSRTASTLLGLGFSEEEINLPIAALSGGQRSKIGLAKLLLSNPELLLLDEPTNHLDIGSIEWLEEYLSGFQGAIIIISHDRYFLDKLCQKTLEIKNGHLLSSSGNYTRHLEIMAERELSIEREYEKNMQEIARIEGIIAQQKTFSMERNYRTIEHKQKSIDRIKENLILPERKEKSVHFTFSATARSGNDVLKAEGISKSFGDKVLFENISLDIKRGERVFLLGANGSGKTTLLRELLSSERVKFGAQVTVGYFDQLQSNLNLENTLLDEVWNDYRHLSETKIRSALSYFLFEGDAVYSKIGALSGGERARVALCKLMLSGNNCLILDEPTNHLDLRSRETLENALSRYDGTVIAVSHDRYFINKLSNKILYLEGGGLESISGNYDDFLKRQQPKSEKRTEKKQMGAGGKEYHDKKLIRKNLSIIKTSISKCEQKIAELEAEISNIEHLLEGEDVISDFEKTLELTGSLDSKNSELEGQLTLWEELQEKLLENEES